MTQLLPKLRMVQQLSDKLLNKSQAQLQLVPPVSFQLATSMSSSTPALPP